MNLIIESELQKTKKHTTMRKLIIFFLAIICNASAYSQKSNSGIRTLGKLSFVWMLKSEAPIPNNTLYKECININGDEATIARYYTTATVLLSENPDDKHTETFKIYTATLKGKKLKLVNNGPDKNEYFTFIRDKKKNILRMVNTGNGYIYEPTVYRSAPMKLAQ